MNFGRLIVYVAVTLFAFFMVSPIIMNAIARFGVQKRFGELMVDRGVISHADYRATLRQQQIIGVIVSAIVLAILMVTALFNAPWGWICAAAGLLMGGFKNRKAVQYNSFTVQSFKRQYDGRYDGEKLNEFIEKEF